MQFKSPKVPQATILRLSIYYRYLQGLMINGTAVVSSVDIAQQTNVNPAQLRKDLSYFGKFGVRGVGYDVPQLLRRLKSILGLERERKMALVGLTHIGRAILQHEQLGQKGYNFEAVFDCSPANVGTIVGDGYTVLSCDVAKKVIAERGIEVVVLTVDQGHAQEAADLFIDAGVRAFLCFSSTCLSVPSDVFVRYADFTILLDTLTFSLSQAQPIAEADRSSTPFNIPYQRVSAAWGV